MIMTFFALSPQKQLSLSLPLLFNNFVSNLEPEFFQIKITEKMYLKGEEIVTTGPWYRLFVIREKLL